MGYNRREPLKHRKQMKYFKTAHFIYNDDSQTLLHEIQNNDYGVKVKVIHVDEFHKMPSIFLKEIEHIVVSLTQKEIIEFLKIAYNYKISIGFIPLSSQKEQIKNLYASSDIQTNIDIALRDESRGVDLLEVNGKLLYSQGVIGDIPLVGDKLKKTRLSFFRTLIYSIKKLFSLELQKFEITTQNGQKITTAASAIIILNHTKSGLISKMFNFHHSMRDGRITIVIISPYSILEYFKLLANIFSNNGKTRVIPKSIGYIQSKSFTINATNSKSVHFKESNISLPISCKTIPQAIKMNASEEFWKNNEKTDSTKETIKISNLPDNNESDRYISRHIPFFKSASEERFKELFQILRSDAKTDSSYLVLMILSTLLAVFGLFANSTAVIIGAMLVAPLMTPIVSLAMGLLRAESKIIRDSLLKIFIGVFVALLASSLLAFLLPNFEINSEIRARVNPTLLDLGVAILAGIAAAFTKSFKKIAQNLAGVAIAVALVPPLGVAGIGLGYGDFSTFFGAFLLFFTNLVGIIIAAVLTFQTLGFSSVLQSKKSVAFIFVLLLGISYPLYLSYDKMIEKYKVSKMLKQHRFIVNQKYVIINSATLLFHGKTKILHLDISVRESLNREDFEELKESIKLLFNEKLFITTKMEYIL